MRQLTNAKISHVSYVDKGANKKTFFMTKSEEAPVFTKDISCFVKNEDEQRLVYGIVYEPDVLDSHNDFMKAEDIEKAAHYFMTEARNIDKQHDFKEGYGEVVESYIAQADFSVGEQVIKQGSWVLVTKATEEVWESIKKGEITGYSMAGQAEIIEKSEDTPADMKKLFKMLKDFFSFHKEEEQKEEIEMTKEEMQELLKSALEPVNTKLADLEKQLEEKEEKEDIKKEDIEKEEKEEKKEEKEDIAKSLSEALSTALAPISERLEAIEKARGISKSADTDPEKKQEEVQKSVWEGLF